MKENGYSVRVFGYDAEWWHTPLADYVRCTRDIAEERLGGKTSGEFLEALGLRCLPAYWGYRLYRYYQKAPPISDSPYYCTIKFREMVRGIKHTPRGGNYTFVHMILPHGPNVLDEEGAYVGREHGSRLDAVRFVDRLVAELIAELKRQDRYDSSLIVIHADTGARFDPDLSRQSIQHNEKLMEGQSLRSAVDDSEWREELARDASQWPTRKIMGLCNAALLIKPPYHRGHQMVEAPTQLMDIPPTILGAVGIPRGDGEYPGGVDLLHAPPGADRVRRVYACGPRRGGILLKRFQEFVIHNGQCERGAVVPWTNCQWP
jgi:hypothetical protein